MNFLPSNLGAERKKVIAFVVLMLVAIGAYFWSTHSYDTPGAQATSAPGTPGSQPEPQAIAATPTVPVARKEAPPVMPMQRVAPGGAARGGGRPTEDFKLSLKPKEGVDISSIDPTLHLDRLAKLHNLPMEGGERSVFKEGSAPPPPPPPVTIKPTKEITAGNAATPPAAPAAPAGPPPAPPPAPIPLKFYGFVSPGHGSGKKAFFLDGDDIHIAGENDVIRNRYKIIRIGVNSAVVEDTTDKHQQTLALVEEFAG